MSFCSRYARPFAAAASLLFAASACYSPSPGNGLLHCAADGSCPSGYVCASNNTCYQQGSATPPDAPGAVAAAGGVRSAVVTWSAPAKDGGSAITGYLVTATPGGATASALPTATSASVSGLDDATAYTFTVIATNAIGSSSPSAPSAPTSTFGFPGAPSAVTATASFQSASVDWTAPADSGGTPITGYLVQASVDGGAFASVSAAVTGTHAVVTGLTNGGHYSFQVAAVNAVGAGAFSTPSTPVLLAALPTTPIISTASVVTAGAAGLTAYVAANAGETYAWTVSGAQLTNPDGAAGEIAGGTDTITFTVTAAAGAQVSFSCVATNAVGSSAAATFSASVAAAAAQPSISGPHDVTLGDTGLTASVVAHAGMTYNWTLSSNATLRSPDLHGVTSGQTNTLTFDLNNGAAPGSLVQLTAVEVNAAQVASAPGALSITVDDVPVAPTISAPAAVAVGETGASASLTARSGMTYLWTLTGATSNGASTSAGVTNGASNSLQFDVTAALNGTVSLSAVESNAAGRSSSAGTASIPVVALPGTLGIAVQLDNGAQSLQFQSGATQAVTAAALGVTAKAPGITGAAYAWQIIGSGAQTSSGESGHSSQFKFDVTGSSGTFQLQCTATLGSASASGSQTVSIVAAPVVPAVSIDAKGAAVSLTAADASSHTAAVVSPVAGSTYAWSSTVSADVATLGSSGSSVTFALAGSAAAGASFALQAVQTNAAGRAGTAGQATVDVVAATLKPAIVASSTAVAPAQSYSASIQSPQSGISYSWAIAEKHNAQVGSAVACPSSGLNVCSINGDGSLSFTVDANLPVDGTYSLELSLTGQNAAGETATAGVVDLPVIAMPAATITFGTSPAADAFGAHITAGDTRSAFAPGAAQTTYAWTVSAGQIVSGAAATQVVFNASGVSAGGSLLLGLAATNAAGTSHASVSVAVGAPSSQPAISVSAYATDPGASAAYATQSYTASIVAPSGGGTPVAYRWSVTGGTSCTNGGALCGIAPAAGSDPNGGTFNYTVNAALGSTLSFSVVAIDAAGDASAASAAASQTVVPAPTAPALTDPLTIPGAPDGLTFSALDVGLTYDLHVPAADVHTGMTYSWMLGASACSAASHVNCTDKSSDGSYSAIEFTVGTWISLSQPSYGEVFPFTVAEVNLAGASATSSALNLEAVKKPGTPLILFLGDEGLGGHVTESTESFAWVSAPAGNDAENDLAFLWSATLADGTTSVLDASSTASGTATTDAQSDPFNEIFFDAPAYSSGAQVRLNLVASNGSGYAAANEEDITVEPAPVAPAIDVPLYDSDGRSPAALTYGASVPMNVTSSKTNADGSAMQLLCSATPHASVSGLSSPFTLNIASISPSITSGLSTTISCSAANAAQTVGPVATLAIPLAPPLAVSSTTPAEGASSVALSPAFTVNFTYAPAAAALNNASCSGQVVTLTDTTAQSPVSLQSFSLSGAQLTFQPSASLTQDDAYTLAIPNSGGCALTDAEGVPLGAAFALHFTAHAPPDINPGTLAATPLLQAMKLAWTNPTDAQFDHVAVSYKPHTGSTYTSAGSATSGSAVVSGLLPLTSYDFKLQVVDSSGAASSGITVTQATALSGTVFDFTAAQLARGVDWSLDGSGAFFGFTWDANNLYIGYSTGSGGLAPGDALWIGMDTGGTGSDSAGVSQITYDHSNSHGIVWPFLLDDLAILTQSDGTLVSCSGATVPSGTYVANLYAATDPQGSCTGSNHFPVDRFAGTTPVIFSGGTTDELIIPVGSTLLADASGNTPTKLRLAFAYIHAPAAGDATAYPNHPLGSVPFVADMAPRNPNATDVLGGFASLTASLDSGGHAFSAGGADLTPTTGNTVITPAPALVAFQLDGSTHGDPAASVFAPSDIVQILGHQLKSGTQTAVAVPPLAPVATESRYQLVDDGTRGDATAGDFIYSGLFNFGGAPQNGGELDFEFADNGSAEPNFGGGKDRVYTLSGQSEQVTQSQQSPDPIAWGAVYSATHAFTLGFTINNQTGDLVVGLVGNAVELDSNLAAQSDPSLALDGTGNLISGAAVALDEVNTSSSWTQNVSMSNHDFVSGNADCTGATANAGCPLQFVAVFGNGIDSTGNQSEANVHTMNDDVINRRILSWANGDTSTF